MHMNFNSVSMKTFGIIFFVLFAVLNCNNVKLSNQEEILGISIERTFPNLEWDSVRNRMILTHFDTFYTKIYHYKKQILIQSNQQYRHLDLRGLNDDEKENLINNTPYQMRYYTFIYSKDRNTGVVFCDTCDIKNASIVNRDSMLAREWVFNPRREDLFNNNYRTLISTKTSEDGNIIEEYTFRNKKDSTMTGTIILVFSKNKFDEIEYSMAKEIEQQKKMKLIKIVCINDARYIPPSNTYIERIEVPWELKHITITNEKELIKMFKVADSALRR